MQVLKQSGLLEAPGFPKLPSDGDSGAACGHPDSQVAPLKILLFLLGWAAGLGRAYAHPGHAFHQKPWGDNNQCSWLEASITRWAGSGHVEGLWQQGLHTPGPEQGRTSPRRLRIQDLASLFFPLYFSRSSPSAVLCLLPQEKNSAKEEGKNL